MIQVSPIDGAINRLLAYFESRVVTRPHATAAELAELESRLGSLPRELTILYATCNGLRIDLEADDAERHIWNVREIVSFLHGPLAAELPDDFMPVRGDPIGELDCVFLGAEPMHNSVVRWDVSARGVDLLSSSFGRYFDRWTSYLTQRYDRAGRRRLEAAGVRFAGPYIGAGDAELSHLNAHPQVREWLGRLRQCVPCGDDFE